MDENEPPIEDAPAWRLWLPHLIIPAGCVPGIAIIFAFGPTAFAGYLLGLLVLAIATETLLERRWPIHGDDGLEAELDGQETLREN